MKYIVEENLSNFKFWSGGADRARMFTASQLDDIGDALEREYADASEPLTDTEINDLFWFDVGYVASLIGLELDEDENIIEDMEEWAGNIVVAAYPGIGDDCFDDFWFDQTSPHNEPDWSSKRDVLDEFEDWLEDHVDEWFNGLDAPALAEMFPGKYSEIMESAEPGVDVNNFIDFCNDEYENWDRAQKFECYNKYREI